MSLLEDEPASSEASSKRNELVATSVGVAGSLRSQALTKTSILTRDEVREMATDIMAASANPPNSIHFNSIIFNSIHSFGSFCSAQ